MLRRVQTEFRTCGKIKQATAERSPISGTDGRFIRDLGMSFNHDEVNRKLGLGLQIEILQRSLVENEDSWKASGLGGIANPLADSIRRDIAEREELLAQDSI